MRTVKHPHDRENLAYYLQGLIDNKYTISAPDIAKRKIELCIYKDGMKALVDGIYYPVTLRDNLQDGIGETMSTSLKNIIYEYMLTDCKKICA